MRIVQISTCDLQGGAALAAFRLNQALVQAGYDSHMLVRHKSSDDIRVLPLDIADSSSELVTALSTLQIDCINQNRTSLSNTPFTLPYPGISLKDVDYFNSVDVINLHWVAYLQSPYSLRQILELGKPVLWTLHDMWAFTGGCHYSAGCQNYQNDCSNCPQLLDYRQLPQAILSDKIKALDDSSITIVSPSQWLANCARKSQLFKNSRIEVIRNSVDTDIFYPVNKLKTRNALGIDENSLVFLFGSDAHTEIRKGYQCLINALTALDEYISSGKGYKKICFMHFGKSGISPNLSGIQVIELGYLSSKKDLRNAYSAADMFVLSSIEDNLPNTLLEAMSCGLPVLASKAGGIPEVVKDGVHGKLFSVGSDAELFQAIFQVIENPTQLVSMSKKCREESLQKHSFSVQAKNYSALYYELLHNVENWQQKNPILSCRIHSVGAKPSPFLGSDFQTFFDKQAVFSAVRVLDKERYRLLEEQLTFKSTLNTLKLDNQSLNIELSNLRNESEKLEIALDNTLEKLKDAQSISKFSVDKETFLYIGNKIKASIQYFLKQFK